MTRNRQSLECGVELDGPVELLSERQRDACQSEGRAERKSDQNGKRHVTGRGWELKVQLANAGSKSPAQALEPRAAQVGPRGRSHRVLPLLFQVWDTGTAWSRVAAVHMRLLGSAPDGLICSAASLR